MKFELALYHLLLDCARSVRVGASPDMEEFLDDVVESLGVAHKRNIFSVTWKYRHVEYGPIQIPSKKFEFYARADTMAAANRLRESGYYRAQNWRHAVDLLGQLAETSGIVNDLQRPGSKLATLADAKTATSRHVDYIGTIPFGVAAGLVAWFLMDPQAGIFTGLLAFGLVLLSERLVDAHLNQPSTLGDKILISSGALLPAVLGVPPTILVLQIVPLTLLSHVEVHRSTAALWILPGLSLFLLGSHPWTISVPYASAFLASAMIWTFLMRNRFPKDACRILMAGTIVGGLAGIAANYFMPTMFSDSSVSVVAFWPVAATFVLFFVGVSLLWIHGSQYSLIPWTMCFCLMMAMIPSLFTGSSSTSMTGAIGMALVISGRVLSAAWRSRQKSLIRG